jgi:hypothetical protein
LLLYLKYRDLLSIEDMSESMSKLDMNISGLVRQV